MDDQPATSNKLKGYIILTELIGLALYIYLTYRLGGANTNQLSILIDTFLFYLWLVFWQFFFAQFILPVQTLTERGLIFKSLWIFMVGRHGGAKLIENGDIRESQKKSDLRGGPGVALVDTASAIMLRTETRFTRSQGPGVVFTQAQHGSEAKSEYIAGVVDLRPQIQILGPNEKENPFLDHTESEKEAVYQERRKRRYKTSGLTRNGIEVVPNILVSFQLNTLPGLGGTEFGYNGLAVRSAITGEGVDPDVAANEASRKVTWDQLPAYLAANIWRETLAFFTLNELFQDLSPEILMPPASIVSYPTGYHPTALDFINARIKVRLTQEMVDQIDGEAHFTGKSMRSLEYRILKDRGIRVKNVLVSNLHFQEPVEKELVQKWESSWYQQALAEREMLETQLGNVQENSQTSSRAEYSRAIVQHLKKLPTDKTQSTDDVLLALLESSLHFIIRDAPLRTRTRSEEKSILNLISWIKNSPTQE